MFAVPGWAVSASSLVKEPSSKKKTKLNDATSDNRKVLKKRKREEKGLDEVSRLPEHKNTLLPQKPKVTSRTATSSILQVPSAQLDKEYATPKHKDYKDKRQSATAGTRIRSNDIRRQQKPYSNVSETSKEIGNKHEQRSSPLEQDEKTALRQKISALPLDQTPTYLTPLQAKMRNKLTSARFRHLNETLYTSTSTDAFNLFTSSPELFADYHAGFAQQVKESWPQNPVSEYVKVLKSRGAVSEPRQNVIPLPRRKTGSCTIADLGCGDAPLARGCQAVVKSLKLKFHNYDLHAANSFVTKADIAQLPLRDGEADIVVFCLSLMGTNWISFVEEGWRVLRGDGKGEVWVAEVKSRFGRATKGIVVENSVGKRRKKQKSKQTSEDDDEFDQLEQFVQDDNTATDDTDQTDLSAFCKVFTRRGFQLRDGSVDRKNKMFVSMIFTKTGIPTAGKYMGLKWNGKEYQKQPTSKPRFAKGQKEDGEVTQEEEAKALKPCVYKSR